MILITIETKYNIMIAHEGKLKGAKLEWRGAGIEIYKKGHFGRKAYESAANLALNICLDRHIPTTSLKKVKSCHQHTETSGSASTKNYGPLFANKRS